MNSHLSQMFGGNKLPCFNQNKMNSEAPKLFKPLCSETGLLVRENGHFAQQQVAKQGLGIVRDGCLEVDKRYVGFF